MLWTWVDVPVVTLVYGVLFMDWKTVGNPTHEPFQGVCDVALRLLHDC
jgi:hypothetical protein